LIFRSAAGAAVLAFLPTKALAHEPCGNTLCPAGYSCCNELTSTCCKPGECIAGVCINNPPPSCSPPCGDGQNCVAGMCMCDQLACSMQGPFFVCNPISNECVNLPPG
jgi:hypothetical protein